MVEMKIIANTKTKSQVFETMKEACDFFGCTQSDILQRIESGAPINDVWYVDELFEGAK